LLSSAENFNGHGFGLIIDWIIKCIVCINEYMPLCPSSYLPTPPFLAGKHCIINVQNFDDNLCFVWSILAYLFEPKNNPCHVSQYR
jgi:hypothetical protein